MSASALTALPLSRRTQVAQLFQGLRKMRALDNFVRVMRTRHSADPLGVSGGPSRFSPLSTGSGGTYSFGVLYLAEDLATAVYETLIRDRFDLNPSRVLMPADYALRDAVNVSSSPGETLTLLDLTGGNAVRCGVPSDVIRYSVHTDGQHFSEFVHAEMPSVDGFLYSSRLTERSCVAIYERACHKLAAGSRLQITGPLLTPALQSWNVDVRH